MGLSHSGGLTPCTKLTVCAVRQSRPWRHKVIKHKGLRRSDAPLCLRQLSTRGAGKCDNPVLQTAARPSGSGARSASTLPRRAMSSPGIEPGLRPSQSRVRVRHTPRTSIETRPLASPPPGNRTRPCGFEGRRASATPAGKLLNALARSRTWSSTFGGSRAVRHTPRAESKPTAGLEPA